MKRNEFQRSPSEIFISQEKYVDDLLKMFNMSNYKFMSTSIEVNEKLKRDDDKLANEQINRILVESLIYLINTIPGIVHAIYIVLRYTNKPNKTHLMTVMRILWYMKLTKNFSVKYEVKNDAKLIGYLESD